jgi:hypothetical protein
MPATYRPRSARSATVSASAQSSPVLDASAVTGRRYRREAALGPRCPQCAGPLVFGEGCSLCPVCGYSACAT